MSWEEFVNRFQAEDAPAILVQPLVRDFVSVLGCNTLNERISRACERDIDLENLEKRKTDPFQTVVGQATRPRTQDSRLGGQQGRVHCAKSGRTYVGACRETGRGCFICGQMGIGFDMFSLQPSGPQEGRLLDANESISEDSRSCYFEHY